MVVITLSKYPPKKQRKQFLQKEFIPVHIKSGEIKKGKKQNKKRNPEKTKNK